MGLANRECEVEGCSLRVNARGMCSTHYAHWRKKHFPPEACSEEGCERPQRTLGVCHRHYHLLGKKAKPCACGCGELAQYKYVHGHGARALGADEQRKRGRCNDGRNQRDKGSPDWYRKVSGKHEHRAVVEAHIGRTLTRNEVVHHKNGNKKDNRIENLEVMTRSEHIAHHRQDLILGARGVKG